MVSAQDYHLAMTILDYYVKRRFTEKRYADFVSNNPTTEIAKAIDDGMIKVIFVCGDEDLIHIYGQVKQSEIPSWPPYYLNMLEFHDAI